MSIINGVAPMNVDHIRHEEPSTPSKDPLSSPAVHIQWQNSQSACAAMEELRAASSMPRHLSNPLQHQNHLRSISSPPHLLPGHHLPPPPPLPPHLTPHNTN